MSQRRELSMRIIAKSTPNSRSLKHVKHFSNPQFGIDLTQPSINSAVNVKSRLGSIAMFLICRWFENHSASTPATRLTAKLILKKKEEEKISNTLLFMFPLNNTRQEFYFLYATRLIAKVRSAPTTWKFKIKDKSDFDIWFCHICVFMIFYAILS